MGLKYNFTQSEIDDMITLYTKEIKSIVFIAKKYKVDTSVISKRLTDNNVKIPKKSAYSKEYWMERGLTEEEAHLKVKTLKPCLIEYWTNKGLTEDEAKLKTELHLMNTERAYIIKYGNEEGVKKFKKLKKSQGLNSKRRVEYWINKGYSREEAEEKVSESQSTFSLKKCIEKYGEEEGKRIFTDRQNRWQDSLTNNGNLKRGFSKISQDLFYTLLNYYDNNEKKDIKFWSHNNEFKIDKENGGIFLYDFTDLRNKKIIEYNGDMYHANPKKYKKDDTPHPFRKDLKSHQIWEADRQKIFEANKEGYEVLVIWDSDFRWGGKNKVLNKCLKFLNKKK